MQTIKKGRDGQRGPSRLGSFQQIVRPSESDPKKRGSFLKGTRSGAITRGDKAATTSTEPLQSTQQSQQPVSSPRKGRTKLLSSKRKLTDKSDKQEFFSYQLSKLDSHEQSREKKTIRVPGNYSHCVSATKLLLRNINSFVRKHKQSFVFYRFKLIILLSYILNNKEYYYGQKICTSSFTEDC